MRNTWFPGGIAEYVTAPELKTIRLNNVVVERDMHFAMAASGAREDPSAAATWQRDIPGDIKNMSNAELRRASAAERERKDNIPSMSSEELTSASAFQKPTEVEKLTPARSTELVDIFVPPRLDFYRQPIPEEKEPEKAVEANRRPQFGGVAGDLLAARTPQVQKSKEKLQSIYGSVSIQDV